MKARWQLMLSIAVVIGGIISATSCYAQSEMTLERRGESKRILHTIEPSESLHHIFQNVYSVAPREKEKSHFLSHEYKKHLRSLLALQFNDNVQIGVDSFKTGPLSANKREINSVHQQYLQPKENGPKSRGYGLELRMKLDEKF